MTGMIQWVQAINLNKIISLLLLNLPTLIFSVYLEGRDHRWLRFGISASIYTIIEMLMEQYTVGMMGMGWYAVRFLLNAVVVYSYCRVSWMEALQCAINGTLTAHLGGSIYILLFVSMRMSNVVGYSINLIVCSAVWFIFGRRMAHHGHYHVKGWSVLLVSVMTVAVTVILSYMFKTTADPTTTMSFEVESLRTMLQLSQLYAIAFCIVMLAVELSHQQQIKAQLEVTASHELLHMHEQQYTMTRDNIDLINRKCHDMKHQIALLMEQQGGSEEQKQRYSRDILKSIEIYDTNIDAGNEVLNTILRDKNLYCSMNDITWTCAAHGAALDFMDPMDLVSMMGNALDNAVEAVERIPDKKQQLINVQISTQCGMVQIKVENTFDGKLNRIGGQLETRKQDRDYHGYGIKSILAVAEKYGGYASTTTDQNTFILNIMIPVPKEKQPSAA